MRDDLYDEIMLASTAPTEESIAAIYGVILKLLNRVERLEARVWEQ